jgi:signal peptidase
VSVVDSDGAVRTLGVVLVVLVIAPFAVHAVPQVVGADHSYVVLSSSMEPTMSAGDVVVVEETPPSELEQNDIIVYAPPGGHEGGTDRVTHRIVGVVSKDGQRHFRTKGDANEDPDETLVPAGNVKGRVTLTIPAVGHVILFAGRPTGILLLVVLPASLLVVSELWSLWRAINGDVDGQATDD